MPSMKTVHVHARHVGAFQAEARAGVHMVATDQPRPIGDDAGPTPLQLLETALAGCFVGTAYLVARQKKLALRSVDVDVRGDLDIDVGAGRSQAGRAGFTGLDVTVSVDGDMTPTEKEAFVAEVRRRCPVGENLEHATPVRYTLIEAPDAIGTEP